MFLILLSPAFVYVYTLQLLFTFHIAIMLSNSVEGHALKRMTANDPENNALICDYACIPNFYPPPPPPNQLTGGTFNRQKKL
jgi:hypothetical protein